MNVYGSSDGLGRLPRNIVIQIEAGKYGVRDGGSQTTEWFRRDDAVDYFEGLDA